MKTRREFIKTATLLTAGAVAMKAFPFSIPSPMEKLIGIQLWTLRDSIPDEILDTLITLSQIGYNSIEPYGFDGKFFGYPANEFRTVVEDLGMKLTSTHTGITLENASLYADEAAEAGLEYLILPSFMGRPDKTPDDFKRMAEELNKIGEVVHKAGVRFGYHNHDFEFADPGDGILYDILLSDTDAGLVGFQLDIFWMVKGGQDPLEYFEKYPGRFETWHIKDMGTDGNSCIIGNGSIDYQKIFSQAELSGMKRFYVEQEQYRGDPIEEVAESYRFIERELISKK